MKRSVVLLVFIFLLNLLHSQTLYLAPVLKADSIYWEYIDTTGKVNICPQYIYAFNFSDNVALVCTRDSIWGLINKKGNLVYRIPANVINYKQPSGFSEIDNYKYPYDFIIKPELHDSIIPIYQRFTKSWTFYHLRKGLISAMQFYSIGNFSEGLAFFCYKDTTNYTKTGVDTYRCGYINTDGKIQFVLPDTFSVGCIYHNIGWDFCHGIALIWKTIDCEMGTYYQVNDKGIVSRITDATLLEEYDILNNQKSGYGRSAVLNGRSLGFIMPCQLKEYIPLVSFYEYSTNTYGFQNSKNISVIPSKFREVGMFNKVE